MALFVGNEHLRYTEWTQSFGENISMRITVFILLFSCTLIAQAGDWPQGLGPLRSGIAVAEPAIEVWPNSGPKEKWTYDLGMGYAGPVSYTHRRCRRSTLCRSRWSPYH